MVQGGGLPPSYIEPLKVESGTVDVVISNCVINLTPDKLASLKGVRHRAGFAEVAVAYQFAYEAPGMDERLCAKIIGVKGRAF